MISQKHIIRVRKNKDPNFFQSFAPLQLIKDKKKDDNSSENRRQNETDSKPQMNSLQNEQSHLFASGLPNFNNDISIDNDNAGLIFSEVESKKKESRADQNLI